MKVVNMGNIADAFKFNDLPATGIVIEATPEELKLLPNLAYKDVTISEHVGNAAAMRETLEKVRFYLPYFLQYMRLHREDAEAGGYYGRILDVVNSALSAPPRNCDVGTAEEQNSRWHANCGRGIPNCKHCKVYEHAIKSGFVDEKNMIRFDCRFIWSQMPYEEGGAK